MNNTFKYIQRFPNLWMRIWSKRLLPFAACTQYIRGISRSTFRGNHSQNHKLNKAESKYYVVVWWYLSTHRCQRSVSDEYLSCNHKYIAFYWDEHTSSNQHRSMLNKWMVHIGDFELSGYFCLHIDDINRHLFHKLTVTSTDPSLEAHTDQTFWQRRIT